MALTAKQQRFVDEYLIDLNATAAYKRAGYATTGHGANVNASKLLTNTEIRAALELSNRERQKTTKIDAAYVLSTIVSTIERCRELDDAGNVLRGTEQLGRHLKLFTDKTESKIDGNLTFKWEG